MEAALKQNLKADMNKIVDMMIQMDSLREAIAEQKKDIKKNYDIPIATITKIATLIRKQNMNQEQEKWDEIVEYVQACS